MRLIPRRQANVSSQRDSKRAQPWWPVTLPLAGLLIAIAVAGLVGLTINRNVQQITERALAQDVRLEDLGDNLRVAVLDVRHYYRDILFYGATPNGLTTFQDAYGLLLTEIENLDALGVDDPDIPQASELRAMATDFYATVGPAIAQRDGDAPLDAAASNEGLEKLARLERAVETLDREGEQRATRALAGVERATDGARLVLLSVLGGEILIGAALVYAAVRVFGELHRLYTAQQKAADQLAAALQAKNDFIADASHELRTPLTVLRGNAEAGLALDRTWVHREILQDIVAEAVRMTRLVEDLLFLARSDAASVPLKVEAIAAEPFMVELAERAETLVREQGVNLTTALAGHGTVIIDAARIEQAVMILIDNAVKYSPPNGRVSLATSTWHDELIIEITDQGPGIPEAELPRIFERFYRADKGRSRKRGGAGLGLSIAKMIVEAHAGRIEAQSRVGEGTKMRIHVPLASSASSLQPSSDRTAAAGPVLDGPRRRHRGTERQGPVSQLPIARPSANERVADHGGSAIDA